MLAEAIGALVKLGQEARELTFHKDPMVPNKLWVRQGDGVTVFDAPPPARAHKLLGYDDFVAVVTNPDVAKHPEVFLNAKSATVLLDGTDRRERATVDFVESARLAECRVMQRQPRSMQPAEVVKFLRFHMHGANVDHVIQAMSRIDFSRTSAGRTDVSHGKESLGRSVEAQVQQADSVPKTFTVTVPIWTNPGFDRYSAQVEFGVYLDLAAQTVELRVLSDEVERVVNLALATVAHDVGDAVSKDVPVLLGEA